MGLAILKTNHHKTLIRQGDMSDAFVKSKYDNGVLIKTDVRTYFDIASIHSDRKRV